MLASITSGITSGIYTGGTSMDQDEKVRENRARRAAQRQGMRLIKSRRRDPRALDYGQFWLVDAYTNGAVTSGQFGISLDEVEEFLTASR
jgi:hypothetical protein